MPEHPYRGQVLEAALRVAQKHGWKALTRDRVAEEATLGAGSINSAYGTIDALKHAMIEEAVRRAADGDTTVLPILAHGLCERYPAATGAPEHLRRAALEIML